MTKNHFTAFLISCIVPAAVWAADDESVKMDQFEVTTTQGHGYVATNAAEAFKTSESLMDIPQIDVVVTSDLIHDVGFENIQDVLAYFGNMMPTSNSASGSNSNSNSRGGSSGSQTYVDEFPLNGGPMNPDVIDSVEIIKGDTEGIYMLNSGIGGIIMESEKKPLPYRQNILTFSLDEWGLWRGGIDSTGPIGKIGDVRLDYRFIGELEGGGSYFTNIIDRRKTLYPYLQATYRNTTVRFHLYLEEDDLAGADAALLTPDGGLYTGGGRRFSNSPPVPPFLFSMEIWEGTILQKFSDTWEMRLSGQYSLTRQIGPTVTVTNYNWAQQAEFFTPSDGDSQWAYWTALGDVTGRYQIGPDTWSMKNSDILGWAFTDQAVEKYSISSTVYPFSDTARGIPLLSGQATTTFAVPIGNPAAVAAVVTPPVSSYYQPATAAGTHTTTYNGGFYWQHTLGIIPNWLDLVGGAAWVSVITDSVANIAAVPWSAQELHYDQWVRRMAAIAHITPAVSIFALDATSFSPSSTASFLANGGLVPPVGGRDDELGMKTAFLGGRISSDFAYFRMVMSNVAQPGGTFPNGTQYKILTGQGVEEGIDGDLALSLLPGWQLLGSFYVGHDRDQNNNPVNKTADNTLGALTRYSFPKTSPLHGLALGLGVVRDGSRWIATTGLAGAALPANGFIKVKTGTDVNGFISYEFNKHLSASIYFTNLLNKVYPWGVGSVVLVEPSPPREFRTMVQYKF